MEKEMKKEVLGHLCASSGGAHLVAILLLLCPLVPSVWPLSFGAGENPTRDLRRKSPFPDLWAGWPRRPRQFRVWCLRLGRTDDSPRSLSIVDGCLKFPHQMKKSWFLSHNSSRYHFNVFKTCVVQRGNKIWKNAGFHLLQRSLDRND